MNNHKILPSCWVQLIGIFKASITDSRLSTTRALALSHVLWFAREWTQSLTWLITDFKAHFLKANNKSTSIRMFWLLPIYHLPFSWWDLFHKECYSIPMTLSISFSSSPAKKTHCQGNVCLWGFEPTVHSIPARLAELACQQKPSLHSLDFWTSSHPLISFLWSLSNFSSVFLFLSLLSSTRN